jgi:predicted amidophosphoribosyltransferase
MKFLNLLFPSNCIVCSQIGPTICQGCFAKFNNINLEHRCHVCDVTCGFGLVHEDCKDKTYLDGLVYVCIYSKVIKDLVKRGKYSYEYSVMVDLGGIMAEYFQKFYRITGIVTPVPLSKRKMKKRGFNQAGILAKEFAKRSNNTYLEIIQRNRNTKTQVGMRKLDRFANLKDAFSVKKEFLDPDLMQIQSVAHSKLNTGNLSVNINPNSKQRTIILVDDIFTSGATLNECSKTLKEFFGENTRVIGLCFAKSRGMPNIAKTIE